MKKLTYLLLSIFFIGLTSCSKDSIDSFEEINICPYQQFYCDMEGNMARVFKGNTHLATMDIQQWFDEGNHLQWYGEVIRFYVMEPAEDYEGWVGVGYFDIEIE